MALPAVAGQTILASDLYGLRQPSGGQETGKYYLSFGADAASRTGSEYIRSSSQGSTPVSLTLDEADQAHSSCGAIAQNFLTQYGFQVWTTSSGAANNCKVGGNTTVQY